LTTLFGFARHPSFLVETTFLLFLSTAGLFYFLLKTKRDKPDLFIPIYLATLVVKLLAMGSFMVFVVLDDPNGAMENAVYFLAVYILNTALEIGFLYKSVSQ
jgi:cytochrome bd-type quinol oxidase subunit 2